MSTHPPLSTLANAAVASSEVAHATAIPSGIISLCNAQAQLHFRDDQ